MDIKTLILIGGGVMIAAVILHGFWIAWRARREPLRLAIAPDLIPDEYDEDARFRGELPNGGARMKREPEQAALELDEPPPVLLDATGHVPAVDDVEGELFGQNQETQEPVISNTTTQRPVVPQAPRQTQLDSGEALRARVREVRLEPEVQTSRAARRRREAPRQATRSEAANMEELLVMYVLAPRGAPFTGENLVNTLRDKGLRYGQMNIFHRLDPMSKVTLFSVANAVEPGTFDLSEVDELSSPGLTFFMRLPGPQQPLEAFDDMWRIARDVSVALGGELKDDHHSVLTAQTLEHYRERIQEYARRTLSRRA